MTDKDVEVVLINYLAQSRGIAHNEVLEELDCSGAIDSLEGVELIIEAEREFGIAIPDSDVTSKVCSSVPELVKLVRSKLSSSNSSRKEKVDD